MRRRLFFGVNLHTLSQEFGRRFAENTRIRYALRAAQKDEIPLPVFPVFPAGGIAICRKVASPVRRRHRPIAARKNFISFSKKNQNASPKKAARNRQSSRAMREGQSSVRGEHSYAAAQNKKAPREREAFFCAPRLKRNGRAKLRPTCSCSRSTRLSLRTRRGRKCPTNIFPYIR